MKLISYDTQQRQPLLERNDVIVVGLLFTVCPPKEYADSAVSLLDQAKELTVKRPSWYPVWANDIDFQRGKFRVRGDVVEFPASRDEHAFVSNFFGGDGIDRICEIESLTGRNLGTTPCSFPATHFMTNEEHMEEAIKNIMKRWKLRLQLVEGVLRLNVSAKGQNTMLKCFVRWATQMVLEKYSRHGWAKRVWFHRSPCLISSQKISSWLRKACRHDNGSD